MLRMYVMDHPSKWEDYLHFEEFSYNNGYHSSLNVSPFKELYRGSVILLLVGIIQQKKMIVVLEILKDMEDRMVKIKQDLKASQERYKSYANKNRNCRHFKFGDHIFLKVRPKKRSLNLGIYSRQDFRYCGPF